jgi:DNA mismatch endonuclease, patch repair protein
MADVHDKATRSFNMSRIKGRNTRPEMPVRKFLYAHGYRYRMHQYFDTPHLVLRKYKTMVFVYNCTWQGHINCKDCVIPKNITARFLKKITNNITKDQRANEIAKKVGWKNIIIWECELKPEKIDKTLSKLLKKLS